MEGTAAGDGASDAPRRPQVGISAPQGCGKTTLVGQLTALLNAEGHAAASVSIDDFYVTGAEQDALAAAAPDNALLAFRGNAGTHDLALARDTLGACAARRAPLAPISVARCYLFVAPVPPGASADAMRRARAQCRTTLRAQIRCAA